MRRWLRYNSASPDKSGFGGITQPPLKLLEDQVTLNCADSLGLVLRLSNGVLDTISIPPGGGIEITRTPQNLLTEYVVLDLPSAGRYTPTKL